MKSSQLIPDLDSNKIYLNHEDNKFDYETLKTAFPSGVHPAKKEYYLTPG